VKLRERIAHDPLLWLAGASVVSFVTGLAVFQAIMRIADLDVVPSGELERLLAVASAAAQARQARPAPPQPADSSKDKPAPLSLPTLQFSSKQPLIEGFESAVPGIYLSDAQRLFPGGVTIPTIPAAYKVRLNSPYFRALLFNMGDGTADPVVAEVVFTTEEEAASRAVLLAAATQFGAISHDSQAAGARLIWPNIGSFMLEVDYRGYRISPVEALARTPDKK